MVKLLRLRDGGTWSATMRPERQSTSQGAPEMKKREVTTSRPCHCRRAALGQGRVAGGAFFKLNTQNMVFTVHCSGIFGILGKKLKSI